MFSVTLPDTMEGRLKSVIEETGGTISELVADAVNQYLRKIEEDRQDIEAARLALEEYERDGGGSAMGTIQARTRTGLIGYALSN